LADQALASTPELIANAAKAGMTVLEYSRMTGTAKVNAQLFAAGLKASLEADKTIKPSEWPRAVSVAISRKTGEVYTGISSQGLRLDTVQAWLCEHLPSVSKEGWQNTANCAEAHACNAGLIAGENPDDLIYWTVEPKTGAAKPACRNSQVWLMGYQTPFGRKP
jgi:hypothetical protein